MDVGVFLREGPGMEVHVVSIEEVFRNMRRLIWIAWKLGVSSNVNSTKRDLSSMGVAEVAVLDCESQGRHHVRLLDSETPAFKSFAEWPSIYCRDSGEDASC
jgi:hypothetical protein